jgi:hypothetical protein
MGWPAKGAICHRSKLASFGKRCPSRVGLCWQATKPSHSHPTALFFLFHRVCVQGPTVHAPRMPLYIRFFFLRPELIDLNEDISMLTIRRENVSLLLPMCSLSKKQMSTWKRRKSSCGAPFFFKRFGASISISSQAYRGQWLHVLEFFDGRKREKKIVANEPRNVSCR